MPLVAKGENYSALREPADEQKPAPDALPPLYRTLSSPAPGLRDMEQRHGLFDMDALLAERLALTAQLAPLDAVVGPAGIGDAKAKSLLYAIALEHRVSLQEAGTKFTEAVIEERARSDARYVEKLCEMEALRIEYVIVRGMVDQLTARMQWAQAAVRLIASEPRV